MSSKICITAEIDSKIAKLLADVNTKKSASQACKGPSAAVSGYFDVDGDEPQEATLRRYLTSDPTPASLGQLLIETKRHPGSS